MARSVADGAHVVQLFVLLKILQVPQTSNLWCVVFAEFSLQCSRLADLLRLRSDFTQVPSRAPHLRTARHLRQRPPRPSHPARRTHRQRLQGRDGQGQGRGCRGRLGRRQEARAAGGRLVPDLLCVGASPTISSYVWCTDVAVLPGPRRTDEDFEPNSEAGLVFCLSPSGCGNALHAECFRNWAMTCKPTTCPLCREEWKGPDPSAANANAGPSFSREGYQNFAAQAGLSTTRDTSTCALARATTSSSPPPERKGSELTIVRRPYRAQTTTARVVAPTEAGAATTRTTTTAFPTTRTATTRTRGGGGGRVAAPSPSIPLSLLTCSPLNLTLVVPYA